MPNPSSRKPTFLLGLTALSMAAIIAGCGGGGGGGGNDSDPDPTATPRPTSLPGGCDDSTYQPNYVSAAGTLRHWTGFPVRVYLEPTDTRTRALTIRGFNQWVDATDGRIRYELVSSAAAADITVKFALLSSGEQLGVTTVYFFEGQSTIENAEIQFYYYPTGSRSDAEEVNQSVAAHEFGHALGIGGHSNNRADLMFPAATGGLEEVTARDLNTMITAYCNNFPTRNTASTRKKTGKLLKQVIS